MGSYAHESETTIVSLFLERAADTRTAIHSHETNLTYAELSRYSHRLAQLLVQQGFQREDVILCRLEKSPWAIVCFLGILRAGLAFTPVSPSSPPSRVLEIAQQTKSKLIFESDSDALQQFPGLNSWHTDESFFHKLQETNAVTPVVNSGDLAYIYFTSGTSGKPKGVQIEHKAIAKSLQAHGQRLGLTPNSRTLQATSYTFDPCLTEIFGTLIFGGCVCVPTGLTDLAQFITTCDVNWAFFTPSTISLISPEEVPSLRTISVGGEALTQECIDTWAHRVNLLNSYGPTEACIFSSISSIESQSLRSNIGHSVGCRTWVVDDYNVPCKNGEVGELLIEGDILARGYLGDPKSTAKSFIHWIDDASPATRSRRLYKTGDLAYVSEDGFTHCVGRKDNQVKIRGQRVELADIESHIVRSRLGVRSAVVDFTKMDNVDHLIAFIVKDPRESSSDISDELGSYLHCRLPSYMIPNHYIFLDSLPTTISGKADRKLLLQDFIQSHLRHADTPPHHNSDTDSSSLPPILAEICRVLSIPSSRLNSELTFAELGGNSLLAIKLVARLRQQHSLHLSIRDVAASLPVSSLTAQENSDHTLSKQQCATASALHLQDHSIETAAGQCGLGPRDVESISQCTPFQEGLLPSLANKSLSFVAQYSFKLPYSVDLQRLKACWRVAYRAFPILRSRFVVTPENGPIRVTIYEDISWTAHDNGLLEKNKPLQDFGLGTSLCHFALTRDGGRDQLLLTLHHLLFDEWSLQLCLEYVAQLYDGLSPLSSTLPSISSSPLDSQSPSGSSSPTVVSSVSSSPYVSFSTPAFSPSIDSPETSFDSFVEFSLKASLEPSSKAFWSEYLENYAVPAFPRLPSLEYQPNVNDVLHAVTSTKANATLINASLALAIGGLIDSRDVCFMTVMSGRDAALTGIDEVAGPTLVTIPNRIQWDTSSTVANLLSSIDETRAQSSQHEHFGLKNIRKANAGAACACDSQTLLVIQAPSPRDRTEHLFEDRVETELRNSHALLLECTITPDGLAIEARFDAELISKTQCQRLLDSWIHILDQLYSAKPIDSLKSRQMISTQDLSTLAAWNKSIPEARVDSVHTSFENFAKIHPDKIAVDSWDGSLTYKQLDELSSKLAASIMTRSPSPGPIVPLHFEKSLTLIICIWAVLKSGRAFVLLETAYPAGRISDIVQQLDNPLMLSHDASAAKSMTGADCWTVNQAFMDSLPILTEDFVLPATQPQDLAFLVMTSGSTGQPKAVMLHHSGIMTTITHTGPRFGIKKSSRMLLFSSVAFDAASFVILAAGALGACVCLPKQGVGLDELANFINEKQVTWSFFTPSFLRLIKPSELSTLASVVAGGEALTPEAAEGWASERELINGYGPAECSVCCVLKAVDTDTTTIGKASGCATWVVDPSDHTRLMPIGAVGELVIEGPLVSQGYLKDEAKTKASFITPDLEAIGSYLSRPLCRMYKTGDLVRYRDDGNLVYVGRRDNQVKLRGQRLELGEIEHHTSSASSNRPAMCFVPKKGLLTQRLVAIVGSESCTQVPTAKYRPGALQPDDKITAEIRALRDALSGLLPKYMVPEKIAFMSEVPVSINGKFDRKAVAAWVDSLNEVEVTLFSTGESLHNFEAPRVESSDPREVTLQTIWSNVLGIPLARVGTNQSFQALGGDSITAMQAVARARNKGVSISMAQILRGESIETISAAAESTKVATGDETCENNIGQPFPLSPLQQTFMALAPRHDPYHFNQSIQMRLRRFVSPSKLSEAIKRVVEQHASLRTRFNTSNVDAVTQQITNDIDGSFKLSTSRVASTTELIPLLRSAQTKVNPVSGPNLYCELVHGPGDNHRIILVATHLIIDLVSWKLILEDLDAVLEGSSLAPRPQGQFKKWCEQKLFRADPTLRPSPQQLDFWNIGSESLTYAGTGCETVLIDGDTSKLCLGDSNTALRSKPVDLFASALILSARTTFGRNLSSICLEGHGRNPKKGAVDVTDVVGWFTTVTAVQSQASAMVDLVSDVKDQRLQAEKAGRDYFADQNQSSLVIPEVVLNFVGVEQTTATHDSGTGLFLTDPDSQGDKYDFSGNMRRFSIFDVAISVRDGQILVDISYNRSIAHADKVKNWMATFHTVLRQLATTLVKTSPQPTLSDYPSVDFSRHQLQKLDQSLGQLNVQMSPQTKSGNGSRVVSIYPATPTQVHMLRAQQANPGCWYPSIVLKTATRDGLSLDVNKLAASWQRVVAIYPILRTILLPLPARSEETDKSPDFLNIVLDRCEASVDIVDAAELPPLARAKWLIGQPQHKLIIAKDNSVTNTAFCRIEINHALIDFTSMPFILETLSRFYDGELEHTGSDVSHEHYAVQLAQLPINDGIQFWSSYLDGASISRIASTHPDVSDRGETFYTAVDMTRVYGQLRATAERSGSTVATIFRLAWARVLQKYTGNDDVAFGFIASGREAPIQDIELIVGPTINIIACRLADMKIRTTRELIEKVKDDFIAGYDHQHHLLTYLASQDNHAVSLFDSIVNFRAHTTGSGKGEGALSFQTSQGSKDPFDYTVTVEIDDYDGAAMEVNLSCWSGCVSAELAQRLSVDLTQALEAIVEEFCS